MLTSLLKQIYLPFLIALFVALFGSVFFPGMRLFAFAPFLALLFMRASFISSLWIAAAVGFLVDLLSSQMRFGVTTLCFTLTAALAFHQKRHFFADKPLALSLYTALISVVYTLFELISFYLVDSKMPVKFASLFTDLLIMPLLDAVYAFLCFTLPMKLHIYLKRFGGLRRFLLKKDEQQ